MCRYFDKTEMKGVYREVISTGGVTAMSLRFFLFLSYNSIIKNIKK